MEFLESIRLVAAMHDASSVLLIPTVIILAVLVLFSVYSIGSLLVELFVDRRAFKDCIPQLIAQINQAPVADVPQIINDSALLPSHKIDLLEFMEYLALPPKSRIEVAKRVLVKQEKGYGRRVLLTDIAAKIAPMLGLMGTLIPLGPGLVALGTGDVSVLSQSLTVAFDTTVVGLTTAVICFVVSLLRRRWYQDYLSGTESILCTLLEKAEIVDAQMGECHE